MGKNSNILNIISKLINIFSDYDKIKRDPALRPKSKMFGVRSIVLSCIGMVLISIFLNLTLRAIAGLNAGDLSVIVMVFFVIILIIIDIYLLGYFVIYPLICWILQISLNKKAVGWVALALWILLVFVAGGSVFAIQ